MLGQRYLGSDFDIPTSMNFWCVNYRRSPTEHKQMYDEAQAKVARLKKVRKPADAINLPGVGKKTVASILADIAARELKNEKAKLEASPSET